jgi:hypothetical protein
VAQYWSLSGLKRTSNSEAEFDASAENTLSADTDQKFVPAHRARVATSFYRYAIKSTDEAVKDTSAAPRIIHSVSSLVVNSSTKHTTATNVETSSGSPFDQGTLG